MHSRFTHSNMAYLDPFNSTGFHKSLVLVEQFDIRFETELGDRCLTCALVFLRHTLVDRSLDVPDWAYFQLACLRVRFVPPEAHMLELF